MSNVTTVLLIRHGQSEGNIREIFTGHSDVPLTELGRRQAACTADYLADRHIDAFYASDLKRAMETAEIIATPHGLPVTPEPRLRELFGGDWEGEDFNLVRHHPAYAKWHGDLAHAATPNGESVSELCTRVVAAMQDIAARHPGQTVCVTAHATPIRVLETLLSGAPIDAVHWVHNASVTVLAYENGVGRLIERDIHAHQAEIATSLPEDI